MTVSEETPLLDGVKIQDDNKIMHELIYKRFSVRQKRVLVAIVSCCGLLPREQLIIVGSLLF
jgi:hypothetical protein